jgi:hypothetical protein
MMGCGRDADRTAEFGADHFMKCPGWLWIESACAN